MRALIVGTGFGKAVYYNIYQQLGWNITTVDIADPDATYDSVDKVGYGVDIAHICTPNFTHYELADKVARFSNIVMVEKPGVANATQWQQLLDNHPNTRFMMVKNNQYRKNIMQMIGDAKIAKSIRFNWINKNRVPKPGSWFTNKELAYGGVSRDLMPHMLSLYQMLRPNWKNSSCISMRSEQRWKLEDLMDSDYGDVDPNGVYDVDDYAKLMYNGGYECVADWRSNVEDDIAVHIDDKTYKLGLCPEDAYERMIKTAHSNILNDDFWQEQKEMDLWIHHQLGLL